MGGFGIKFPTHVGRVSIFFYRALKIALLGGALSFAACLGAQPTALTRHSPAVIAYFGGAQRARADVVKEEISKELERLGHRRGVDFTLTVFSTEGDNDKLREVAQRVIGAYPTLIYAGSWDAANEIRRSTRSVPVVFSAWSNLESPRYRIVENLVQPEGNLTGFSAYVNLIPKKLQLIKEAFPKTKTVGLVHGVEILDERRQEYSAAASKFGMTLNYRKVAKEDLPQLAIKLNAFGDDALLTAQDDLLFYNREIVIAQLVRATVPIIHSEESTSRGVLMHYFALVNVEQKVAEYLSKLLRGAKVRDLAVQEPQEFDLSVNVTTLKRNGLTMSRDVLSRARKVE